MRILFVGDVFGDVGRRVLSEHLPRIKDEYCVDMVIANGENCAGGRGITPNYARKFRKYGVDIITGGNHSKEQEAVFSDPRCATYVLRPANSSSIAAGEGVLSFSCLGESVIVINLLGRIFLRGKRMCPFVAVDGILQKLSSEEKVILVDFHAEATSEKVCMAHYLDGRVSAVVGTHTHVQTNDARIFPHGTAFITDAGMTGPEFSAIGMKHEQVLDKILTGTNVPFTQAHAGAMFNGVLFDIDSKNGLATSVLPLFFRYY
ncbi:TIGR00282 family metallophosphoesterase [Chitinivibrio alkaliphilus]|uniref:Metallophosphoesterase n=1 Tax=Chitinivibrio alkaliphilus ACht1 TaxID=1313304 RepID=U7DBJ5_9BACT|nr:TIGR00282 family metallophosphoesterase [Chitinivibrio alkaliphilus]ERP38938.1 metallophosphoesterase [Chitinivibrio alkaliphilus ACht1]